MADYDLLGNIAVIKSEKSGKVKSKQEKLQEARELLKMPSVKTVLEKSSHVRGRLRKIKTKYVLGEKNKIAFYKENNCLFRFNVDECYFSPRLAHDRKEIAEQIKENFEKVGKSKFSKENNKVLCLFAGVGAYPIVINKITKPKKIVAIEISKACCRYFRENLKLNKIPDGKIEIIQGDVKKKIDRHFLKKYGRFDVIVMTRPNLKDSFLASALAVAGKGTKIFYHGFCHESDIKSLVENLKKEAQKLKRKLTIKKIIPIGNIAPYKFRYRIEMIIR